MTAPLRGRVCDAAGRPVAGAAVMVVRGTAPTPEIAVRTDAEGRFRLALPPGTFEVAAHAQDGRHGRAEISAVAAADEVVIALDGE